MDSTQTQPLQNDSPDRPPTKEEVMERLQMFAQAARNFVPNAGVPPAALLMKLSSSEENDGLDVPQYEGQRAKPQLPPKNIRPPPNSAIVRPPVLPRIDILIGVSLGLGLAAGYFLGAGYLGAVFSFFKSSSSKNAGDSGDSLVD